jgi:hypothetical protein
MLAAIVASFASYLAVTAYLSLIQDPSQSDQVIWTRAAAVGTGAISALTALVAMASVYYKALRLRSAWRDEQFRADSFGAAS